MKLFRFVTERSTHSRTVALDMRRAKDQCKLIRLRIRLVCIVHAMPPKQRSSRPTQRRWEIANYRHLPEILSRPRQACNHWNIGVTPVLAPAFPLVFPAASFLSPSIFPSIFSGVVPCDCGTTKLEKKYRGWGTGVERKRKR